MQKAKSQRKSTEASSNRNKSNSDSKQKKGDKIDESQSKLARSSDTHSVINETNVEAQLNDLCPACADGNYPSDAHKCYTCDKSVHVFPECSVSIGAEEGYGEQRQCIECHQKDEQIEESEITNALNSKETWTRNRKPSRYLKKQPNWGLVPINKKTSIALLLNENGITTVYTINKKKIVLSNSCAIDSVIQLIAAALAYHPAYILLMANKFQGIFRIANMMANGYL